MLKFFVALLLITEGITESDICDKPSPCSSDDMPEKFPETEEELKTFCKTGIQYAHCARQLQVKCWEPGPMEIEMGYRIIATIEEICSEDTLLHAAVVDSLKCFSKLIDDEMRFCPLRGHSADRIRQFAEALIEEGRVTLTSNLSDAYSLYECINMMNFFSCNSLTLERECGTVAKDAYVGIRQKIGLGVAVLCDNAYDLLPAVIRLYKMEEKKNTALLKLKEEKIIQNYRTFFNTRFKEPANLMVSKFML